MSTSASGQPFPRLADAFDELFERDPSAPPEDDGTRLTNRRTSHVVDDYGNMTNQSTLFNHGQQIVYENVTVRGAVVDGAARVSTAFIP